MPVAESELDAGDTGVVDSSSIIIIHPGSRYLRIGRASDTTPKRILHAVARKRRKPAIKVVFKKFKFSIVNGRSDSPTWYGIIFDPLSKT